MKIKAVIFDLDGVIVSTDQYHYQAWLRLAKEEGLTFDEKINQHLLGVGRMESLEIILEHSKKEYSAQAKLDLATRKNRYYQELLQELTPAAILPGVLRVLAELEELGVKIAIGSSSKNTPIILEKIGLQDRFFAVADGNQITHSKPDPEIFLVAANLLGEKPESCVVVEDAQAGVEAALAAKMFTVGVGNVSDYCPCHYAVADLEDFNWDEVGRLFAFHERAKSSLNSLGDEKAST